MRYSLLIKRLVEYVIRKATSLPPKHDLKSIVGDEKARILERKLNSLASSLAIDRNGIIWCGICERGPFTKRGLYLHLMRVHYSDIEYSVLNILKEMFSVEIGETA